MDVELFSDESEVGSFLDQSVVHQEVASLRKTSDGRTAVGRIWRWVNLAQWLKTMSAGALEPMSAAA